jgi:hypothetical protein
MKYANFYVTGICMCFSYQLLGNPAGVKYPDMVTEQIAHWSVIMEGPGLEKN